jgi:hypothetical protein
MPAIKISMTDSTFIPEIKPATKVDIIIARSTLTRFKHKIHNKVIDITAGFKNKVILASFFFL